MQAKKKPHLLWFDFHNLDCGRRAVAACFHTESKAAARAKSIHAFDFTLTDSIYVAWANYQKKKRRKNTDELYGWNSKHTHTQTHSKICPSKINKYCLAIVYLFLPLLLLSAVYFKQMNIIQFILVSFSCWFFFVARCSIRCGSRSLLFVSWTQCRHFHST